MTLRDKTEKRMPVWTDDIQGPDEPPLGPDVLSVSKLPEAEWGGQKTLNGLSLPGIDLFQFCHQI